MKLLAKTINVDEKYFSFNTFGCTKTEYSILLDSNVIRTYKNDACMNKISNLTDAELLHFLYYIKFQKCTQIVVNIENKYIFVFREKNSCLKIYHEKTTTTYQIKSDISIIAYLDNTDLIYMCKILINQKEGEYEKN